MRILPSPADAGAYFREVYHLPPATWLPALHHVAVRHGLADGPWERAALGRNVVFLGPAAVVKLGPPFWAGDMAREAAALGFVAGRLPAATPEPLGAGAVDGWEYLALTRLPGEQLHAIWPTLGAAERTGLALQHGELMAALHALRGVSAVAPLRRDWAPAIAEQRAACLPALERSGVPAALVAQAAAYIDAAMPRLLAATEPLLIHGDLCHLNMLVERRGGGWRIAALIDWGDSNAGPQAHELISPAVNMYRGDQAALAAWLRGYGVGGGLPAALAHEATARAILHYADELGDTLRHIGAANCADWAAVTRRLWGSVAE